MTSESTSCHWNAIAQAEDVGANCWRATISWAATGAIAAALVVAYQIAIGAARQDFVYGDSASHFVTGVMIADYASTALGSDPVAFAEEYYVRAPKVAFGRWPPLFHFLQAAWYLAFGVSKQSALTLVAVTAGCALVILFNRLRRLYGLEVAALGTGLFASYPAVRWHSHLVMSDMLTVGLCMLAAFSLADFVASRRTRDLYATLAWSLLAMLTKETAFHLLILVPLVLAATGKSILKSKSQRRAVLATVALGGALAAFWLWSGNIHGFHGVSHLIQEFGQFDSRQVFAAFFRIASPLAFAAAALGALGRTSSDERRVHVRVATIWLAAIVAFFLASPAPPEGRYFMPALVPLTLLAAQALFTMRDVLRRRLGSLALAAPAVVCALAIVTAPDRVPTGMSAYAPVAQSIPVRRNVVALVSAETFSEGAFVVDRLLTDRDRSGIVLRADKVLASSDWHGGVYRLLAKDRGEVRKYLHETPVHYIVLDRQRLFGGEPPAEHELLRSVLADHPEEFVPVGAFPRVHGGQRCDDAIVVYENICARRKEAQSIRIALNHTLCREIALDLNAPQGAAAREADGTSGDSPDRM